MMPMGRISGSLRPTALADWVYDSLKASILHLELRMGEQIDVDEIAESMRVSRTPVREALLRLDAEGLVQAVPRVGFFVAGIEKRDLQELFELRALLESYAAKRVTPLLTDQELAHLDALLEESCRAVDAGDLDRFLEYEIALHTAIYERAQSRQLLRVMDSLADLTYRERILSIKSLENVKLSCEEHRKIIDAMHQRNAELAGTRMWEHVWAVSARMLDYVEVLDASTGETV